MLIVGWISGSIDLEVGCQWVVDENRRKWAIKWPAGYDWAWDGESPILNHKSREVARFGDRLWLRGTLGWYDEDEVNVKFKPGILDGQTDENGPAEHVVKRWAADHGVALAWPTGNHVLGWWLFLITDGSTPGQKVDELTPLPEIDTVLKSVQGDLCGVGRGFTVTSVELIEPAPSS